MKIPRERKSRHHRRKDKVFIILQSVMWSIDLQKELKIIL